MRDIFCLAMCAIALSPLAQVQTQPSPYQVSDGTLQHFELYSPQLQRDMPIDVWLPSTYDPARAQGYPVIYMHDGQNLFDATKTWNKQAWEIDSVCAALIQRNEIETPVVVGIYNNPETRVGDLMPNGIVDLINPELVAEGVTTMCPMGVRGDLYIDFLAETLKPVVDSLYNTRTDPASTSVIGSSMGGLISLDAIALRPDIFGSAACVSTHITGFDESSIFPTALNAFLIGHLPIDGNHRIYVDTGDQDIDTKYVKYFPQFVTTFTDLGYREGDNFESRFFPDQGHREDNWMLRVEQPIKFLLRAQP